LQLVYLWVDKYKNFDNCGFHFTSALQFSFEKSEIKKRLRIQYVEENNPFLFAPPISEITALIGNNGSGKSTVLDLIKEVIPEGQGGGGLPTIIIFRASQKANELIAYSTEGEEFEIENATQFKVRRGIWRSHQPHNVDSHLIERPTTVFYSNDFNVGKDNEEEVVGLINLSTNYLIRRENTLMTNDDQTELDSIPGHVGNEYLRNFRFIVSSPRNGINFPMPGKFLITDLALDVKHFMDSSKKSFYQDLTGYSESIQTLLQRVGDFKDGLAISLLCNHIRSHTSNAISPFPFEAYLLEIRNGLEKNGNQKPFELVIGVYQKFENENNPLVDDKKKIGEIQRFLSTISRYLSEGILKPTGNIRNQVYLEVTKQNEEALKAIIDLYSKATSLSSFVEFRWRNLSSGEQSRLTLFSRLFSLIDDLTSPKKDLGSSILLLLDEADIGFHPEWQRTLLSDLIEFLKSTFAEKSIQIIIAANSPFITSDLPRSNINFFHKIDHASKVTVQVPFQEINHTFGANIHLLLTSGFYMRDFMGEFAKAHIEKAFKKVHGMNLSLDDIEFIKKTIAIMGEPVLREHLNDLLIAKSPTSQKLLLIDEEIRRLQTEKGRLLSGELGGPQQ